VSSSDPLAQDLRLLQRGEVDPNSPEAIAAFRRIERILRRLVRIELRSACDIDEVLQEVCLSLFRYRTFDGTKAHAYLRTIVKNAVTKSGVREATHNQRFLPIEIPDVDGETDEVTERTGDAAEEHPGYALRLGRGVVSEWTRRSARAESIEIGVAVEDAVDRIPEPYRTYIKYRLDGYTYQEIAEMTGASEGAVKMAIHRILKRAIGDTTSNS
jgi:RNA polymerase sigma factor (sigma-70 family)